MKNNYPLIQNEHVFIFGVCARSSSTALQRILNSSNELCVWGEQHYLIDDILVLIEKITHFINDPIVQKDFGIFQKCIEMKDHEWPYHPYMHAMGNLDNLKVTLIKGIMDQFHPLGNLERFGFKDIRIRDKNTLTSLINLFPNCKFIFLFRNPLDQWPSVNYYKWWNYSNEITDFLEEYQRISQIFLEYSYRNNSIFIENINFDNPRVMSLLMKFLKIKGINPKLVTAKYKTHELKDHELTSTMRSTIMEHMAYKNYLKMQKMHL